MYFDVIDADPAYDPWVKVLDRSSVSIPDARFEQRVRTIGRGLTLDQAVILRDHLATKGDPRIVECVYHYSTERDSSEGFSVVDWTESLRVASKLSLSEAARVRADRFADTGNIVVVLPTDSWDGELGETDLRLRDAINERLHVEGLPNHGVYSQNTGGGCMVMVVALDTVPDGRQIWISREGDEGANAGWAFGLYDFSVDDDGYADEGVMLDPFSTIRGDEGNDPDHIAQIVAKMVRLVGKAGV
jgi:hypothetical protein